MNLPYVLIGVVRRHVPPSILFRVMQLRGGGSVAEFDPDDYFAQWNEKLAQDGVDLTNKHVLEVGSGPYARLALRMLQVGARRVTLVDPYAVSLDLPRHRKVLVEDCAKLSLDFAAAYARITVVQADLTALPPPRDEDKVDLVLSTSVLEHVRDPQMVLQPCRNWLRPGGATHHLIDLRDHNLGFRYPFEMLTFSDRAWTRWFDLMGGFHLNRWRAPDYLRAMDQSGFINVRYNAFLCDAMGVRAIRPRLDARFRAIDDAMLAILRMSAYGERA